MSQPPDLLLITWNRREYVEKTVANLLADNADFRLYCWDNASSDGAADIVASLKDPRIVRKHFSKENVKQRTPWLWFINEAAQGDLVGKLDDDILLPHGWTERVAPLLRANAKYGVLACWIFMPEDWDESLASHKIVELAGERVYRNPWIGGTSFLIRKKLAQAYVISKKDYGHGLPLNQCLMSRHGLINGFPLPLMFAHHMDDPRSPHCRMHGSGMDEQAALTARLRNFNSLEEYAQWIANDARWQLTCSLEAQHRLLCPNFMERMQTTVSRGFSKLVRTMGSLLHPEKA
jgi:hypothetical protein